LQRSFYLEGRKLADPDPSLSIEEVRNLYSGTYPALNNSSYETEVTETEQKITFSAAIGHKG
jgi:PRTRC genetic system protein C